VVFAATGTFPCDVISVLGKVHHTPAKNGFVGKIKIHFHQ
jgi:hypothetical protein